MPDPTLSDLLEHGPSTADVLARMPPKPWGGLKSYLPEQPDWMKAAQGYLGQGLQAVDKVAQALPPGVADAMGVVLRGARAGQIGAYHVSPHKFEKFDSSKLLTGEGANAYMP